MPPTGPRLTELSHGAGCGCKIPAAELRRVVAMLPLSDDPRMLVGPATADDAGVYLVRDDLALIQTVDFFTPIVDDPYDFGRIAAANALSDVYAMGGAPLTALNLVAFSLEQLGHEVLGEILRGGQDTAELAGAVIVGGHSIDDREPKYGLAVTGTADPERLLTNAGGRPGDALVLTKPLGAGAVATAAKRGLPLNGTMERAIEVMTTLNEAAGAAALQAEAHAVTDVTGFGLLGHLHELTHASGLSAEVHAGAVPAIEGVLDLLVDDAAVAGGSRRNAAYADTFTTWEAGVDPARRRLLTDAMTSGGLLIAADAEAAKNLPGPVIGYLAEGPPGLITVLP